MVVDLKKERGKNILKRLIKKSDALVENYRSNVKQRLGIAYEDLKPLNPRLVYASAFGFGRADEHYWPSWRRPCQSWNTGRGPLCRTSAAQGALAVLLESEQSSEGQWVKRCPNEAGNNHATVLPTRTSKAKDGQVNIAPTNHMRKRLRAAVDTFWAHPNRITQTTKKRVANPTPITCTTRPAGNSNPRVMPSWVGRLR